MISLDIQWIPRNEVAKADLDDYGQTLHEMACIRRYDEPVYSMCTERYTDVYGTLGIRSV